MQDLAAVSKSSWYIFIVKFYRMELNSNSTTLKTQNISHIVYDTG